MIMDINTPAYAGNISSLLPLNQLDELNQDEITEQEKEQIAKDFESLIINQLLDEMKNTIGEWGSEKDGASTQIQGIFWMYLARDIADNGGLGLWKEIYKTLPDNGPENSAGSSLDKNL
jgi:Rod binding domain-containing protein